MAIPTVFNAIKPQDVTQTPVKVYKRYSLDSTNLVDTSSGYRIWSAVHTTKKTPYGTYEALNDPTNSFDGTFQHATWYTIDGMYYRFPYDPARTLEHSNKRFTYKFLNFSASILSLPYLDFGESIKPGSVEISHSNFLLSDDKNGNLYDVAIDTGSFAPRQNLVAYWGFNETFRAFKYREGYISDGRLDYQSNVYEVDRKSYVTNVNFGTGSAGMGMSVNFHGEQGSVYNNDEPSYILTEHKDDYNFGQDEDFSISFWFKNSSNIATGRHKLIEKNGFIEKTTFGNQLKYQGDIQVSTLFESRSFQYDPSPIYPFCFEYRRLSPGSRRLVFTRSDGINTTTVSASIASDAIGRRWNHVAVVKQSNNMSMYLNGELSATGSDTTQNTFNKHALMFGGLYKSAIDAASTYLTYNGSLDEIRIYDTALSAANIATLANSGSQAMFQTAVCGNVFYKRGNIVVSGFDPKYQNCFGGTWNLKYRGTHTIYQNEILVRIPPGDFNLSQNPTARQSYKSDLLINDMVTGSLMPVVTEIGFYDDQGNLLVVAKPNQGISMRTDTMINISTKFDY